MHQLTESQWVAIAAHCLQHRWRSIDPDQLDDTASDLWRDDRLRALEPAHAVETWLSPLQQADAHAWSHRCLNQLIESNPGSPLAGDDFADISDDLYHTHGHLTPEAAANEWTRGAAQRVD